MSAPTMPSSSPRLRNNIPVKQNEPRMLELLQAKCALYDDAQGWYRWQFIATGIIPVLFAVIKLFVPALGEWFAGTALLLFAADLMWLDPRQSDRRKLAAVVQEMFDCEVLELPYRSDRTGSKPDAETIRRWAQKHPSKAGLRDWYPTAVGRLPLPSARVACQRANGLWNGQMRTRYAHALRICAIVMEVALIVAAWGTGISVRGLTVWAAIALPVVNWLLREDRRQRGSAAASIKVAGRARKLWERLLTADVAGVSIDQETRELQNDIFDQRKCDQQVFSWVYDRFREEDEEIMRVGADALVAEYERTYPSGRSASAGEATQEPWAGPGEDGD